MIKRASLSLLALAAAGVLVAQAGDVTFESAPSGRTGSELNISGATLFRGFFTGAPSTNDWLNVDADFDYLLPCDPNDPNAVLWPFRGYMPDVFCTFPYLDSLAPDWDFFNWQGWWLLQYRGVGSGNGLKEFVNYQLTRNQTTPTISLVPPNELGLINRYIYTDGGAPTGACCIVAWVDPNDHGLGTLPPTCQTLTNARCVALDGTTDNESATWLGAQTVCEANVCDPMLALGACDYDDGGGIVCDRFTEANCTALSGTWRGVGTVCEPPDESGSPSPRSTCDLAIMDVPTKWFVTQPDANATPVWHQNPSAPGYGLNPVKSWDQGYANTLKSLEYAPYGSLNTNTANPDENTVFDTPVAWVAVGMLANAGTGLSQATIEELQYAFVTGRFPDGRNFVVCTRDSGSGTRNGGMNGLGIDPSWGRGDNLGIQTGDANTDRLGPSFQPTNKGGSSRMEDTVQNCRLGIGYSGLYESGRAIDDAAARKYEILDVSFDGGSHYVRPSVAGALNACSGNADRYPIGGPETFASRGNPFETNPASPAYMYDSSGSAVPWPPLTPAVDLDDAWDPTSPWFNSLVEMPAAPSAYPTQASAADFLRNIKLSIDMFGTNILRPGEASNLPAQYLATNFFLLAGQECVPDELDPTIFVPNPNFNATIQAYTLSNQVWPTPAAGQGTRVPLRLALSSGSYSDGSTTGNYHNPFSAAGTYTIVGGSTVSPSATWRNLIAGDFAYGDHVINTEDVEMMLLALHDPIAYRDSAKANSTSSNPAVPEIIGDLNGDGNFDAEDVRYLADSCLVKQGTVIASRVAVHQLIDTTWQTLRGNDNFFGTVAYDCAGTPLVWVPGWTAFDVAGGTPWPGARPHGFDGRVDCTDLTYVCDNYGDWSDLAVAAGMDLSCDMNGDLVVDQDDAALIVAAIGGCGCQLPHLSGDLNCDGSVDFGDINPFVDALVGGETSYYGKYPCCRWENADFNSTGVGFDDINPFVDCLVSGNCP